MSIRGIRGAISVEENTTEAILKATHELLQEIIQANLLEDKDIASAFFTLTPDLNACFPAVAARQIGWTQVPLLCATEIDVPDSMGMLLRVLIHWNTPKNQEEVEHIYLGRAMALRPDIAKQRA